MHREIGRRLVVRHQLAENLGLRFAEGPWAYKLNIFLHRKAPGFESCPKVDASYALRSEIV